MITSHGGNVAAMEIAARELRLRHGMLVVTTSWGSLGEWEEIYDLGPVLTDIHGGNSETSLMLALRPDLVDGGAVENFDSAQSEMKARHMRLGFHGSDANIAWAAQDLNSKGVVGDASAASKENGERDITEMVAGFCVLMEEVAATAPPGAGG